MSVRGHLDLLRSDVSPRSRALAAAALAVLGPVTAALADPARTPIILVATIIGMAAALSWNQPQHLAWATGALLPVQVVDGLSLAGLEALHIGLVGVVLLRFGPRLSGSAVTLVAAFGAALGALALAQLGFGLVRDPLLPTLRYIGITMAALVAAVLLASRIDAHRPLLLGYLAGTSASATVALLQVADVDWIRTGFFGDGRFPGMAFRTPGLSWHIVVALLIGLAVLVTARSTSLRRITGAQMLICSAAFLACGAQGGIAGLGFAGFVCARLWRQEIRQLVRERWAVTLAVVVALALGLLVAGALGFSSVRGLAGDPDKGYTNEMARVESIGYGTEQLLANPLGGIGAQAYDAQYEVRPHFLPLNASVTTGILGFAIGALLVGLLVVLIVRGPIERTPCAMLGVALLSAMFVQTLLTPSGTFAAVERISMLLIGVGMLKGGSVPFPRVEERTLTSAPGGALPSPAP